MANTRPMVSNVSIVPAMYIQVAGGLNLAALKKFKRRRLGEFADDVRNEEQPADQAQDVDAVGEIEIVPIAGHDAFPLPRAVQLARSFCRLPFSVHHGRTAFAHRPTGMVSEIAAHAPSSLRGATATKQSSSSLRTGLLR